MLEVSVQHFTQLGGYADLYVLLFGVEYLCSVVVKALGYKPESRGFETRWGEILNLPNPSGRTRPWGSLSL
jgi:hypothetical protein